MPLALSSHAVTASRSPGVEGAGSGMSDRETWLVAGAVLLVLVALARWAQGRRRR